MEFSEEVVIEGAEARVARNAFLNMDLIVEVHPFTPPLIQSFTNSLGAPTAEFMEAYIVGTARQLHLFTH
jgi:hypothetical protein